MMKPYRSTTKEGMECQARLKDNWQYAESVGEDPKTRVAILKFDRQLNTNAKIGKPGDRSRVYKTSF